MLDLSGLAKLGQLFSAIFQAFWPILVIIFVGSILLILLGVGARFGLGGIFNAYDNRIMRRKSKAAFAFMIAISLMLMLMAGNTPQAQGADGSTGTLEIGVTNILDSTPITIRMYDLTSSADFQLNWTGENTGHSFTTGSQQTEHYVTVNIDKPSATHDVTIYLRAQSAGTVLDSLTVYVSDTSIFPDDILIDIGVTVAVVFVIVAAVMILKRR